MELVEKTELLRRLSVYALSKIRLDRYGSFRKILFILSWNINLNPEPAPGIQNENFLHVLPFHDSVFFGDEFYYNLNSLGENVSRNEWDAFKKRGMHFIPININSLDEKAILGYKYYKANGQNVPPLTKGYLDFYFSFSLE